MIRSLLQLGYFHNLNDILHFWMWRKLTDPNAQTSLLSLEHYQYLPILQEKIIVRFAVCFCLVFVYQSCLL